MVQLSKQHSVVPSGMHKNAEQDRLIVILHQDDDRKRSTWLWKSKDCVSIGEVSDWSLDPLGRHPWIGSESRQLAFDEKGKKGKQLSLRMSVRGKIRLCQQEQSIDSYKRGMLYNSESAVYKTLITTMNTLRELNSSGLNVWPLQLRYSVGGLFF